LAAKVMCGFGESYSDVIIRFATRQTSTAATKNFLALGRQRGKLKTTKRQRRRSARFATAA
jgi:hypothetical protein